MNKKTLLAVSLVLLFGFAMLSKYEDREVLRNADFTVTVRVQDAVAKYCPSRCDGLLEDAGFFASPLLTLLAVISIAVFYLGSMRTFHRGKKRSRSRQPGRFAYFSGPFRGLRVLVTAAAMPFFLGLLTVAEVYGKSIVRHPAPPFFMLKNPTAIFPTYHIWQEFSYPSGHAARSMFLGILLYSFFIIHKSRFKKKDIHVLMVVGIAGGIALIAFSRVYLGHHWLSDVVGGWLLGGGLGVLGLTFLPGKKFFRE